MNRFAYLCSLALTLVSIIAGVVFFPTAVLSQSPEWMNFTSGANVSALADDGEYLWVGAGGLARLNKATGEMILYNSANSGLPDNDVEALAIDAQGNKWIGTSGGLAKFDGTNWTVYNTDNSELLSNHVSALIIDAQENIWIGSPGGGLAKFDGTNWMVYDPDNSGLPDHLVWALTIDAQENIWIGTGGGGLAVYREGGVISTGVEERRSAEVPSRFSLSQNHPNPFNASTTIRYALPEASKVEVAIYDALGRRVRTLVSGRRSAGKHRVVWDGKGEEGRAIGSGVYVYRLKGDHFSKARKMMMLK